MATENDDLFKRFGLTPPALPSEPSGASDVDYLLDQMQGSVKAQESGGKQKIRNHRTDASGLFQVLPTNIGPWTQKYLGKRLTQDQFLNDANAQNAVFRGEMGKYLREAKKRAKNDDEAIRMAAAAWYGGERAMNRYDNPVRFRADEPSFREYTNSVLGRIKKGGKPMPTSPDSDLFARFGLSEPNITESIDVTADGDDLFARFGLTEQDAPTASDLLPSVQNTPNQLTSLPDIAPNAPKAPPTVPENPMTLAMQASSVRDINSPRMGMLLQDEQQLATVDPNLLSGFVRINTPNGILVVNPAKAKQKGINDVREYVAKNGFAGIIGKAADVGNATDKGLAVVTTTPDGIEITSSIVNTPDEAEKQKAIDKSSFPNIPVQHKIMPAQNVVAGRIAQNEALAQPRIETLGGSTPEMQGTAYPSTQKTVSDMGVNAPPKAYDQFIADTGGIYEYGSPESIKAFNDAQKALANIGDPTLEQAEAMMSQPKQAPVRQPKVARSTGETQTAAADIKPQTPLVVGKETDDDNRLAAPTFKPSKSIKNYETALRDAMVATGRITQAEANNFIADRKRRGVSLGGENWTAGRGIDIPLYVVDEATGRPQDRIVDERMSQAQNRVSPELDTSKPFQLSETEAEKAVDKRIRERDYSVQQQSGESLSEWMSDPWNILTPLATKDFVDRAIKGVMNSGKPVSEEWIAKEKDRLLKQHGSFSKAWDAEQYYKNSTGIEKAVRMVNEGTRSFAKNLVGGTAKTVAYLDNLNETYGLQAIVPEDQKISIRNAGNALDFVVRLMSAPDYQTAVKEWDKVDGSDLSKTHLMRAAKEFDEAIGEDPVLKGRFLGALGNAGGSAAAFIAMGVLMPSMQVGKLRLGSGVSGALQMAGSGYEEGREQGLTEGEAKLYGAFQGLLGFTEMFGGGQEIIKGITSPVIRKNLALGILDAFQNQAKNVGSKTLAESRQEFFQEVFQTSAGKAALEALKDRDASAYERVKNALNRLPGQISDAVANEGVVALVTGGGMGAGGAAVQSLTDSKQGSPSVPPTQQASTEPIVEESVTETETVTPKAKVPTSAQVSTIPTASQATYTDKKGNKFTLVEDRGDQVLVTNEKGGIVVRNKKGLAEVAEDVSIKAENIDTKEDDVDAINITETEESHPDVPGFKADPFTNKKSGNTRRRRFVTTEKDGITKISVEKEDANGEWSPSQSAELSTAEFLDAYGDRLEADDVEDLFDGRGVIGVTFKQMRINNATGEGGISVLVYKDDGSYEANLPLAPAAPKTAAKANETTLTDEQVEDKASKVALDEDVTNEKAKIPESRPFVGETTLETDKSAEIDSILAAPASKVASTPKAERLTAERKQAAPGMVIESRNAKAEAEPAKLTTKELAQMPVAELRKLAADAGIDAKQGKGKLIRALAGENVAAPESDVSAANAQGDGLLDTAFNIFESDGMVKAISHVRRSNATEDQKADVINAIKLAEVDAMKSGSEQVKSEPAKPVAFKSAVIGVTPNTVKLLKNKQTANRLRKKGYEFNIVGKGSVRVISAPDGKTTADFENDAYNTNEERLTQREQNKGKSKYQRKNLSLWQFVRQNGGIRPTKVDRGEVDRFSQKESGKVGMVNKNGRSLDDWTEHAWEMGYFSERPAVNDFLKALEDDLFGGNRLYSNQDELVNEEELSLEDQEAIHYAEKQRKTDIERRLESLTDDQVKKAVEIAQFLNDSDAVRILFKAEEGIENDADRAKLFRVGKTYDLDKTTIEGIWATAQEYFRARSSQADTASGSGIEPQGDRDDTGYSRGQDSANTAESIYDEEERLAIQDDSDDGDISFDFSDEDAAPSRPATAFDQTDLFGNKLTPQTEQQGMFGDISGVENRSPDADISAVQKTIERFESRSGNDHVIQPAKDALSVFAQARKTRSSVDAMLSQQNLDGTTVADSLNETALKFVKAMDKGTFDAAIATAAMEADAPLRQVPHDGVESPLDSIYNEDGSINYEQVQNITADINEGKYRIQRLTPAGEQGRLVGDNRLLVGSSIVIGGSDSSVVGQDARKRRNYEEDLLEGFAKTQDAWVDDVDAFRASIRHGELKPGAEAQAYKVDDSVIKIAPIPYVLGADSSILRFFDDKIALHNSLPHTAPYELIGFGRDWNTTRGETFVAILRQPFITGQETKSLQDAFVKQMQGDGFLLDYSGSQFKGDGLNISDVTLHNVVHAENGQYIIFDPMVSYQNDADYQPFEIETAEDAPLRQAPSDETFYSQVERVIEQKMPNKATAEQIKGILSPNNGIKAEELEWLDLDSFLAENPKPTKQELLDYVRANNVQVEEVVKGSGDSWAVYEKDGGAMWKAFNSKAEADAFVGGRDDLEVRPNDRDRPKGTVPTETKFSQYTLKGGENYKELLLTMPPKDQYTQADRDEYEELSRKIFSTATPNPSDVARHQLLREKSANSIDNNYRSSHWDEPNVLAHVRFDDRDGGKTLHVAEIQSDLFQDERKQRNAWKKYVDMHFDDIISKMEKENILEVDCG